MLKKLIPGVLALALVANVNANTEVEKKEEAKVASFVTSAKELGFSNEEIVKAFATAVENADENGVTTLSLTLNNDQKKIAIIVGGVVVTAAAAYLGYAYYKGKFPFKPAVNNNQNQQNAGNQNAGDQNAGDQNAGDQNAGDQNAGDQNA